MLHVFAHGQFTFETLLQFVQSSYLAEVTTEHRMDIHGLDMGEISTGSDPLGFLNLIEPDSEVNHIATNTVGISMKSVGKNETLELNPKMSCEQWT